MFWLWVICVSGNFLLKAKYCIVCVDCEVLWFWKIDSALVLTHMWLLQIPVSWPFSVTLTLLKQAVSFGGAYLLPQAFQELSTLAGNNGFLPSKKYPQTCLSSGNFSFFLFAYSFVVVHFLTLGSFFSHLWTRRIKVTSLHLFKVSLSPHHFQYSLFDIF